MQRIAIIDIGSNSARLVISHIYKSGAYNMVFNQKEMLRLAQKTEGEGLLPKKRSTARCRSCSLLLTCAGSIRQTRSSP